MVFCKEKSSQSKQIYFASLRAEKNHLGSPKNGTFLGVNWFVSLTSESEVV